jgi:hypothetical protein
MKKDTIKPRFFIKQGLINRPFALFKVKDAAVGLTKADYFSGKLIELSPSQADFYRAHPAASFSEIMEMEIQPEVIAEIPIEEQYKQRVKELIAERYTLEDEIRILYNGRSDPRFAEHEAFVSQVKNQIKQELDYE